MARLETSTVVRLVLNRKIVQKMYDALKDKKDDEWWLRLVLETDVCDSTDERITLYLQGADGEEETLIETDDAEGYLDW